MKIYCMSDIHGCLAEFEDALGSVLEHLEEDNTMLLLLGDYVHGGGDNYGVLDKIMNLQEEYGSDKVVALMGNHDYMLMTGQSSMNYMIRSQDDELDKDDGRDDKYIDWISNLPMYYTEGNTIFVHAGIDESAGEDWECSSDEKHYLEKYPPTYGQVKGLSKKIVAGHVYTSEIAMDKRFCDVFYDGKSHYFIDGNVVDSGIIPVLLVDTDQDKYYQVMSTGPREVLPSF